MEDHLSNDEIKKQFKLRKKKQWLAIIPAVIFLAGYQLLAWQGPSRIAGWPRQILLYPFMLFVMVAIVFIYINWRCPACRKYLGLTFRGRICPKCGAELKD